MGNICRSPLAEGVFRHHVSAAGLSNQFDVDSAGISSYHAGDPPDERTTRVARARGIELQGQSRPLTRDDLARFDYIIAMDGENRAGIARLEAKSEAKPAVHMLREFDDAAKGDLDVPDPYYGGPDGFENVHDIVDRSTRRLLEYIRARERIT